MGYSTFDIQYLRIIVTNQCNLNCYYCHKEGTIFSKIQLEVDEIIMFVELLYELGIRKVKLMGGEPTLRNDLTEIIKGIRNISNDIDLSLITNGIDISEKAIDYINMGLNRINISIHGWEENSFYKITGSTIENYIKIKKSIEFLTNKGYLNKINFVLQKGVNELELLDLIKWSSKHNVVVDILNVLYNSKTRLNLQKYHYEMRDILIFLKKNLEIEQIQEHLNVYSLNSTRLVLRGGGIINLKTESLNTQNIFKSCNSCSEYIYCSEGIKAIRLTTDGILQPCLFRDDNLLNLKQMLYNTSIKKTKDFIMNYLNNL